MKRGATAMVAAATHGLGEAPGLTTMDLAAAAGVKALAAAGLAPRDVNGLFVTLADDAMCGLGFAEYLGLRETTLVDNSRMGGSSFLGHAMTAALALGNR
jgi:3-oxoacyl-[acyl-carrier-protein] synthase III